MCPVHIESPFFNISSSSSLTISPSISSSPCFSICPTFPFSSLFFLALLAYILFLISRFLFPSYVLHALPLRTLLLLSPPTTCYFPSSACAARLCRLRLLSRRLPPNFLSAILLVHFSYALLSTPLPALVLFSVTCLRCVACAISPGLLSPGLHSTLLITRRALYLYLFTSLLCFCAALLLFPFPASLFITTRRPNLFYVSNFLSSFFSLSISLPRCLHFPHLFSPFPPPPTRPFHFLSPLFVSSLNFSFSLHHKPLSHTRSSGGVL